ncbi:T9SS type A sorting domain-containing protein [Flavobacterium sp.]|uniref:T9SS type A sorting domain-containing protein n=1 Tax=Flavobacterium sp. TaxID=239 RepID=UPI0038FCFE24
MKYLFTIFLLHFYFFFFGQITYTKIPLDLQLVARDKTTNLGNVNIEGEVNLSTEYESLKTEIYRNDVLFNTVVQSLTYIDSKALFAFNISIKAELANFSFKIYGYKSSNNLYVLDKTISNVVAGDTYIIQGQSNAVASKMFGSANAYKSDFIRVYANGTPYVNSLLANDAWYIADGDVVTTSNGNSGQWGLKLARLLVDNLGIPIAIFNGANGAQVITFFKAPQDYKTSQNSNYGRLYYRLKKTGLENSVRAFFWSQGEANSGTNYISIQNYKSAFKSIQDSYLKDYPNIEKFYIFQTKDMICNGKTYEGKMNVKEAQRQLASESDKIDIISTTSLLLHSDSCHFPFFNGYEEFAKRLYKLVLQDLYDKSFTEEIKSPMIKSAEFIQPNVLVLETDAKQLKFSSTDQAIMLTRLKQDFELKNSQSVVITNVNLVENKILFTLSGDPGPIANISFVGYNSNIGYTITNSSDLELICFRNFPIKNYSYNGGDNSNYPIIENTSICNVLGSTANIYVFKPNTDATYRWLFKIPNGDWTEITTLNASTIYLNYNSPILEIKKTATLPASETLYRVVANYGILGEFTSNEVALTVDSVPVSKLITGASTICSDGSKILTYGSNSVGFIQWQYSTVSNQENFIDIDEENGLTYSANNLIQNTWYRVMNSNGVCPDVYSPVIQVVVVLQPVSGYITGGNVNVCKSTNSTILSLNNYSGAIQWQKASSLTGTYSNITSATLDSYTASVLNTTTYFRAVLSNGICLPQITEPVAIFVNLLPVSKTISGASTICFGDNEILTYGIGSVGDIQWQYSTTSSIDGFIDIEGENSLIFTAYNLIQNTWFRVKNTSGKCSFVFSQAVEVIVNPIPITGYISGGNVNVCITTNSTILSLNDYVGTIQWQKASSLTGTYSNITSATLASYTASVLNTTTYFRAVLSNGICLSQITEPVAIFVNLLPVSKTISGASTICFGDNEILTYGTGSVGDIQWQYSTTSSIDGFIDIEGENSLIFTAYNLIQNTWFRVKNTSGKCSVSYSPVFQASVNTNIIPVFNQIAPICNGAILSNLPTTSINYIIGNWSPVINNLETKTYTFKPSSNTCASSITMDIVVNSTPTPIGDSIQIFNFNFPVLVSNLNVTGSNIKWYSTISNALTNSNVLNSSSQLILGNTYYAMQFVNGCFSISPLAVTVTDSLGFNEYKTPEIKLFPNPFNNSFIVEYSNKITSIELFNVLGQSVLKTNSDSKQVAIDVNFLPSGIYFAKIISEDHNTLVKGIKL